LFDGNPPGNRTPQEKGKETNVRSDEVKKRGDRA